ncbi:hypothetical protein APH_1044 [Anaplasma phagocytophilum str. HZ]|uniref:Uncharacterized protein n=1 Tax=Anaplasma phagocytophilum (strain HZ) TaxID=212042 RepID=Q2GJ50_ANAPZ|nr:hypothetical protein APH_1044 [Anaplasma phagocytophilum str. HZ]
MGQLQISEGLAALLLVECHDNIKKLMLVIMTIYKER